MGDNITETLEQETFEPAAQPAAHEGSEPEPSTATASETPEPGVSFTERYSEVIGKLNQTLDQVDWNQMGRIGKATGIIVAVIVAQILIKGVLDTINLLPVVPGLLELLGLIVVGQWGWRNLTTSDKRHALVTRIQTLRQEYLG
ncbi:MAG: CAAD domain-containing protein [Cyanobacteriota bacterium]|nr:CAAD domain-containing protein [Cyanobacteriota bacterium]